MQDQAIPAATLIVVRERDSGAPELLMVERAEGMAFAAGALVFPGGRIDEADRDAAASLGADPAAIAAIRETIEETAVPVGVAPPPAPDAAIALQDALNADGPILSVLARAGFALDLDALTPFARWVPRFHAVRRFDTLFFVARCPPGA
jgi:8-oxo-dGTP pyrophosphatase MutT (NUDIX family)